jgi:TonB family protein
MRHTLIASALFSPLFLSAAALAASPATDVTTPATARPLSTGVKFAHVIYSPSISIPSDAQVPANAKFVLHLNVDEAGKASDVQVVESANAGLDASVAKAVRQFRFSPATLDKQPVATDMTLTVLVQR